MSDPDHPSALLTDRQRAYLNDELDLSPRGKRAARERIRKRLRASIIDLQLIVDKLPLDDLEKALAEPTPPESISPPVPNSMSALATVLYLYNSFRAPDAQTTLDVCLRTVNTGVRDALTRRGESIETLELTGHIELGDPLDALPHDTMANIPKQQLDQLYRAGLITAERYAEAILVRQEEETESADE